MMTKFAIFERKGEYPLFHITDNLNSIIDDGYITGGLEWDHPLRQNVIANWEQRKYKTISATRNLNYMAGDTFELNVEKITDKFKILQYSENPDFYNDFVSVGRTKNPSLGGNHFFKYNKMEPAKSPHVTDFQNQIRSKSKGAGDLFWRVKTDKKSMDFGIAEELILTDKLDIGKYVKRIFLELYVNYNETAQKIKDKYPHIEIYEKKDNYYKSLKSPIKIGKKVQVLT